MSVPTSRQAFVFLAPLRGRSSVFITPGRGRNASVVRFLMGCLAASRKRTAIFDTSSFFGTNIRTLTESLPREFLMQSTLVTPQGGQRVEDSMAELLAMKADAILIDDLNALHYLLSTDRQKPGIQRLFALIRLLSYESRINRTSVFGTVYKTESESAGERVTRRSLSAAADLQIFTDDRAGRITFRCDEASGWPNNRFSAPLYLEPST